MHPPLTLSRLTDADHAAVHALLATRSYVHTHFDWRPVREWLADAGLVCWVARDEGQSQQVLACVGAAVSSGGAAWLRLAALSGGARQQVLDQLWREVQTGLRERDTSVAAVLPVEGWIEGGLRDWGFHKSNAVVTLRHRRGYPPDTLPPGVVLRNATDDDLDDIAQVDRAAFEPLWRHDRADLLHAAAVAVTFTVAEVGGKIVGYQLSTQHSNSGHLARLAVAPGVQKQGIGSSLVSSVLTFFHARRIREVTVNTQRDNLSSQALYRRLGFGFTSHSVPVWTLEL